MAATALIQLTQGVNVGVAGQALKGEIGTQVDVANSSNTDVASWQIELVYVDPSSALSVGILAFNDNSNTPAASFTPDVRGSYRLVLKVWMVANRTGLPSNVDIRIFNVPEVNGLVVPAPQLWPRPLPVPQSSETGNKPSEYNFDGQPDGWAGDGNGDGLLGDLIRRVDAIEPVVSEPLTLARYVDKYTTVPIEQQDGSSTAPFASAQTAADALLEAVGTASADAGTLYFAPAVTSYGDLNLTTWGALNLTIEGLGQTITLGDIGGIGLATLQLERVVANSLGMLEGAYSGTRCLVTLNRTTLKNIEANLDSDLPDVLCGGAVVGAETGSWNVNNLTTSPGQYVDDNVYATVLNGTVNFLALATLECTYITTLSGGTGSTLVADRCQFYSNVTCDSIDIKHSKGFVFYGGYTTFNCPGTVRFEDFQIGQVDSSSLCILKDGTALATVNSTGAVELYGNSSVSGPVNATDVVIMEDSSSGALITCASFTGLRCRSSMGTLLVNASADGPGPTVVIRESPTVALDLTLTGATVPQLLLDLVTYRGANTIVPIAVKGLEENPAPYAIATTRNWVTLTLAVAGVAIGSGFPQTAAPTTSVFDSNTTSHAVLMPPVLNSGDLVIVFFAPESVSNITIPVGLTQFADGAQTNVQLRAYGFISNGTEGGTTIDFVTASTTKAVAHAYRVTSWDGYIDFVSGDTAVGTSAAPNPPPWSPTWARDTLWFAVSANNNRTTTVSSYPTDYTDGTQTSNGASTGVTLGSSRRELVSQYPDLVLPERAFVSLTVPTLASGELGYVDYDMTSTALDHLPPGTPITATFWGVSVGGRTVPGLDLADAGAGNGGFLGARILRTNIVRFAFLGAISTVDAVFALSVG